MNSMVTSGSTNYQCKEDNGSEAYSAAVLKCNLQASFEK